MQELLYTSAPRGLKPGSRGFCTVLSTQSMVAPLANTLEGLSGYRPVFAIGDKRVADNPVNYSHLKLNVVGKSLSVLSRVADYGLDYSQRTNKLAHHLVLDVNELPAAGPASVARLPGMLRQEWDGEPKIVPPKPLRKEPTAPIGVCQHWKDMTGDAGWAGVLAESFLSNPTRPIILLFEPGQDLLPLIDEAISLLPPERRWDVTFSTYFTGLPQGLSCLWRCIVAGSKEANESIRFASALRIDLTKTTQTRAAGGELVDAARSGISSVSSKVLSPSQTPSRVRTPQQAEPSPIEFAEADSNDFAQEPVNDRNQSDTTNSGSVSAPPRLSPSAYKFARERSNSLSAETQPSGRSRSRWLLRVCLVLLLGISVTLGWHYSKQMKVESDLQRKPKELAATEEKRKELAAAEEKRKELAAAEEKRKELAAAEEKRKELAAAEEKRKELAAAEEKRKELAAAEEKRKELAAAEEKRKELAAADEKRKETIRTARFFNLFDMKDLPTTKAVFVETEIPAQMKDKVTFQFFAPDGPQGLRSRGTSHIINISTDGPSGQILVGSFSLVENSDGSLKLKFEPRSKADKAFNLIRFCMLRLQLGSRLFDAHFVEPDALPISLVKGNSSNEISGKASFHSKLLATAYQAGLRIKVAGSFIPAIPSEAADWPELTLNSQQGKDLFESNFPKESLERLKLRYGKATIAYRSKTSAVSDEFDLSLHCAESLYPEKKKEIQNRIQVFASRDKSNKDPVLWEKARSFLKELKKTEGDENEKAAFEQEKTNIIADIDKIEDDIKNAILSSERLAASKVSASFWVELINNGTRIDLEIVGVNKSEGQPKNSKGE